jgi:mono/diheme cytochrome c family protein
MLMRDTRSSLSLIPFALMLAARLAASPEPEPAVDDVQQLVRALKLSFAGDSSSVVFLEQGGKRYRIDVAAQRVTEVGGGATPEPPVSGVLLPVAAQQPVASQAAQAPSGETLFRTNCARCHGQDGKGIRSIGTPDFVSVGKDQPQVAATIRSGRSNKMPSFAGRLSDTEITAISQYVASLGATAAPAPDRNPHAYKPGDDVLFSLPTGRPVDEHGLYINFSHRFPYDPAFQGVNRDGVLFGLDESALPSFGLRYGVTDKLSVDVFRSPTFIGRPIQIMAAYNFLDEQKEAPFNFTFRVSIEGQNNFRKNYTQNLEWIVSRSITHRAQLYVVPTMSFNDRMVVQSGLSSSRIPDLPGVNSFSIGIGGALDIRPTVALVAEVIPMLTGRSELDIHGPAFSFGIQKKIYRHAFTFGFTNSPGVTVSQRAGTDASFLNNPNGNLFKEMFVGFNLTRQIH